MKHPLPKPRKQGDFIEIITSHSPYLAGIIRLYPEILDEIESRSPDFLIDKYLKETGNLRLFKKKIALLCAYADLKGLWDLTKVTENLTKAADIAVITALDQAFTGQYNGLFVIAMGKMGAGELNYSSDIDLILFFDAEKCSIKDDVLLTFEKKAKVFIKILQERTSEGYVHRVDVRLRPDPGSTPIVISTQQALNYYAERGQTWERSAFIKARIVAGDIEAGQKFLKDLSPFIWRKYLDFASLSEIKEMKEQINAFKGQHDITIPGHNIKLGRGGIREIEFYAQAQQLIEGGRNQNLRQIRTCDALDQLNAAYLKAPYIFLRNIEHRLQMLNDEQTHSLPDNQENLANFARFCGFTSYFAFAKALSTHLLTVEHAYQTLFFREIKTEDHQKISLDFLNRIGFTDPDSAFSVIHSWKSALKSTRMKEELALILPVILENFGEAGGADQALKAFDKLITKARHPLDLIALIKSDAAIPRLLAKILSSSPRLASQIMRRPHVLANLIKPALFEKTSNKTELTKQLETSLNLSNSFEETLDRMRIFTQEQQFLISARILSGQMPIDRAGETYTNLAEVILKTAHFETEKQIHLNHGTIQDEQTAILAMGKCGSREMSAASDLDLIMLYQGEGESNGAKPLHYSQYFSRFTQKFISNLTAKTNEGELYEVDMRLRPSGKSGQVATPLASFLTYQMEEAWTWEHMALTRARVVSSSLDFEKSISKTIKRILTKKRDSEKIRFDIKDMRRLIAENKGEDDLFDFKNAIGGLTDIEFIAQGLQLLFAQKHPELLQKNTAASLKKAIDVSLLTADQGETLLASLKLQQNLMQIMRLAIEAEIPRDDLPSSLKKIIATISEQPDFIRAELLLKDIQLKTRQIFESVI